MVLKKVTLYLMFLYSFYATTNSYAQEWAGRIALMEEHLVSDENEEYTTQKLSFFNGTDDIFNGIHFSRGNFNAGLHFLMEEDLPEAAVTLQDFFVHSFGLTYALDRFNFALSFENFLNLNTNDFSIETILASANEFTQQVQLEYDTAYALTVSISYSF